MVRFKQIKNDRIEKYQILRKRQFTKMVHILTTESRLHQKNIFIRSANFLLPSNVSRDCTTIDGLIQSIRS